MAPQPIYGLRGLYSGENFLYNEFRYALIL